MGDTFVKGSTSDSMRLYAGNFLGGEKAIGESRPQPSSDQMWADVYSSGEAHRVIAGTSTKSPTWDTPILSDANRNAFTDPAFPGDIVNAAKDGVFSLTAGGRWDNKHYAGVSFICAGYEIELANQYRGARLAYLLSDETV